MQQLKEGRKLYAIDQSAVTPVSGMAAGVAGAADN